jgi:methionyl-tRNA formyltransferase
MLMEEGLDTGPMLEKVEFIIPAEDASSCTDGTIDF